jgi:hypothetical protein
MYRENFQLKKIVILSFITEEANKLQEKRKKERKRKIK